MDEQLRNDPRNRKYEIKALLDRAAGEEFQVINDKYYFLEDFVKALLATEHDRGVKDSYKSIQADFDQGLKDEYDRGKVEGGIEVLEKLKNHLVNGNRLAVGQTLGQVNFVVASEIGAEIMRLERLKSKGESK